MNHSANNGVYYFLGNITSHVLHALPLYKQLGGTFVVTSKRAERELAHYQVPILRLDNINPFIQKEVSRLHARLGLPGQELLLNRAYQKTFRFLEENAKIVLFYELFEFTDYSRLSRPKTIFLTHGAMLKSYFTMYPKRLEIIKEYDFMAAMGPAIKRRIIAEGVDPGKLLNIGIARTDEVLQKRVDKEEIKRQLLSILGLDDNQKLIAYLPTFWGPSSIYNTGKAIIENCPRDYVLLFRPHPQTPKKLLAEYARLIEQRSNVFYMPNHRSESFGLLEILACSELIIGDVSSVMLEAILLDTPLIFAFDKGEHRQPDADYALIKDIVSHSQKVDSQTAHLLPSIIKQALTAGIDKKIWNTTKDQIFYNYDGTSATAIAATIRRLAGL